MQRLGYPVLWRCGRNKWPLHTMADPLDQNAGVKYKCGIFEIEKKSVRQQRLCVLNGKGYRWTHWSLDYGPIQDLPTYFCHSMAGPSQNSKQSRLSQPPWKSLFQNHVCCNVAAPRSSWKPVFHGFSRARSHDLVDSFIQFCYKMYQHVAGVLLPGA